LYAAYKAVGVVSDEELLTLRQLGSRLEGHPTPDLPWVEAATGSLGQGLAVGVGDALSGKYLDKLPFRVWVILGDSEMAEGSVWEAFAAAGEYKLNNMVAIIDVNRLGQRGPTMLEWQTEVYAARARSFGWNAIEIDGHNLDEIEAAYQNAEASDLPTCIIARTRKGHGATLTADQPNWHGKALNAEQAEAAIAEIGGSHDLRIETMKPEDMQPSTQSVDGALELPKYELGSKGRVSQSLRRRAQSHWRCRQQRCRARCGSFQLDLLRNFRQSLSRPLF
jgi:transketolase